ncbi:amino acid--tRNA ligase-related protein, partial [Staphylococcus epidermidis]|uniref:amino acid--tRNA ligase-related protein n=1 Tax=Staphylococcus epidermidis TaxID=1282 RepID=UPI0037DA3638
MFKEIILKGPTPTPLSNKSHHSTPSLTQPHPYHPTSIPIQLHLKPLILGRLQKLYHIPTLFPNQPLSTTHNPQFTIIQLYQPYPHYHHIIHLTQ